MSGKMYIYKTEKETPRKRARQGNYGRPNGCNNNTV